MRAIKIIFTLKYYTLEVTLIYKDIKSLREIRLDGVKRKHDIIELIHNMILLVDMYRQKFVNKSCILNIPGVVV